MNQSPPSTQQRVAILGASANPDRYAYRAFRMLQEHGHEPLPVHPSLEVIEGVPVAAKLAALDGEIDTLTLYVNPSISEKLAAEIVALAPGRVIFNPGTESAPLSARLEEAGIAWEKACTLVLLQTGQF